MPDKRKTERLEPLVIRAEFRYLEKDQVGYLTNLSEGGGFWATEELIPVGTTLALRMELPWNIGQVEAEAEVRWRTADASAGAQHRPPGLGLCFVRLPPEGREKLRLYVQRFRQLVGQIEERP